jgi:cytochrome P450
MRTNTAQALLDEAFWTVDGRRDPYPCFQRLFDVGDYVRTASGTWFAWGADVSLGVLRGQHFSKRGRHGSEMLHQYSPAQMEQLAAVTPRQRGNIVATDPPDHTRLRRLLSAAFTPRSVAGIEPRIAASMDRLLEEVDPRAPADLVTALTMPLPGDVIGDLIGIRISDRTEFARLAETRSLGIDVTTSFEQRLAAAQSLGAMFDQVDELIAYRREHPADDLASRLIAAQQSGEQLSEDELHGLVHAMYGGGFSTTRHMLSNGIVALCRDREQRALLREHPELARSATDEVLRWDAPVMTATYVADAGATIGDDELVDGEVVTVLLGAANWDPRVYLDPSRFDVTRPPHEPLVSFGNGRHYCLGAGLARLQGDVVFTTMATGYPEHVLSSEPERLDSFRFRGWSAIEVILGGSA